MQKIVYYDYSVKNIIPTNERERKQKKKWGLYNKNKI